MGEEQKIWIGDKKKTHFFMRGFRSPKKNVCVDFFYLYSPHVFFSPHWCIKFCLRQNIFEPAVFKATNPIFIKSNKTIFHPQDLFNLFISL